MCLKNKWRGATRHLKLSIYQKTYLELFLYILRFSTIFFILIYSSYYVYFFSNINSSLSQETIRVAKKIRNIYMNYYHVLDHMQILIQKSPESDISHISQLISQQHVHLWSVESPYEDSIDIALNWIPSRSFPVIVGKFGVSGERVIADTGNDFASSHETGVIHMEGLPGEKNPHVPGIKALCISWGIEKKHGHYMGRLRLMINHDALIQTIMSDAPDNSYKIALLNDRHKIVMSSFLGQPNFPNPFPYDGSGAITATNHQDGKIHSHMVSFVIPYDERQYYVYGHQFPDTKFTVLCGYDQQVMFDMFLNRFLTMASVAGSIGVIFLLCLYLFAKGAFFEPLNLLAKGIQSMYLRGQKFPLLASSFPEIQRLYNVCKEMSSYITDLKTSRAKTRTMAHRLEKNLASLRIETNLLTRDNDLMTGLLGHARRASMERSLYAQALTDKFLEALNNMQSMVEHLLLDINKQLDFPVTPLQRERMITKLLHDIENLSHSVLPFNQTGSVVIQKIVTEALELYSDKASSSGISIVNQCDEKFILQYTDPICIKQVIILIIGYILDTLSNGQSLKIRAYNVLRTIQHQKKSHIAVEFRDNGFGLSTSQISKLQDHAKTSLVKNMFHPTATPDWSALDKLVQSYGGVLDIQSVYREGSTITLWLPSDGRNTVLDGINSEDEGKSNVLKIH